MNELGFFIKKKRKEAGLSQQELAKACGISNTTICHLENGKVQKPNYNYLYKIAICLDFDISELPLGQSNKVEKPGSLIKLKIPSDLKEEELKELQNFINFLLYKRTTSIREKNIWITD